MELGSHPIMELGSHPIMELVPHPRWNFLKIYPELAKLEKTKRTIEYIKELTDETVTEENYHLFKYLLPSDYDNLICLAMIVKNAGPDFENVLESNLPFFDKWCILDTGSTDGTQETIKRVLKDKRGQLYQEPFVNFMVSRNRCLDLAGTDCKFIIMLDDTYILKGNIRKFLDEVRGDTFADSFSLMIQSEDTEYFSNRIIKSESNLRYIHTIHEVITDKNNVNVTVPSEEAFIFDKRSEYMELRTLNRKSMDLKLLFKELQEHPDDPRSLYYIAQTYGCLNDEINKAKYFELRIEHPVQGYIQELIDATFELARCYNFKVNCETKEPLTNLTNSQWKRCEQLYKSAYNLDKNRPDSLYFIGIHYYLENNYQIAYDYFKRAFEIGYPVCSQYSLKPTLSFHFLPKFLTEVCYYIQDYNLGQKAAELYLSKNEQNYLILNWYKIHSSLIKIPKVINLKLIVIVTDGGWEPWTGKDIETKGLGGSETWIIETAKCLSLRFNVVVFCNCLKTDIYNGVSYNPIDSYGTFIAYTDPEQLIISRYTEYSHLINKIKNVSIVFHDNIGPELIIPKKTKLFGLSKWHSEQIKKIFPYFEVNYTYYGIHEPEQTNNNFNKIKNSFIYSSFPNRGLIVLLRMWKDISELLPDATLNVYCNLDHDWVNKIAPEMLKEIKQLINQPGITNHGWVNKLILNEAWKSADYWLYPCIFEETFCHTALEAAISNTKVITNGLAGLSETAQYGKIIKGDPLKQEWQQECLTVLSESINTEQNYNWAKSLTWNFQTQKFLSNL